MGLRLQACLNVPEQVASTKEDGGLKSLQDLNAERLFEVLICPFALVSAAELDGSRRVAESPLFTLAVSPWSPVCGVNGGSRCSRSCGLVRKRSEYEVLLVSI